MAHYLVDRGAHVFGITLVADAGGDGPLIQDHFVAQIVQAGGANPRLNVFTNLLQYLGRHAASHSHFGDIFFSFDANSHEFFEVLSHFFGQDRHCKPGVRFNPGLA